MRLLISSILVLAICSLALGQPSQWAPVDPSEIENDPVLQSRLDLGVQQMIKKGIEEGKLPNTQLEVSQTFRVAKSLERGTNYKFDVELSDPAGNKYRIVYAVNYRSWDNVAKVTSYSFNSLPGLWEDPTFKKYYDPVKVAGDPYVASLLDFGIQYVAAHPVPNSPDASYKVKTIHIVQHARGDPYRLWFLIDVVSDQGPEKTFEIEFFDDPFLESLIVNYYYMHHNLWVEEENLDKVHLAFPKSLIRAEFNNNDFNAKNDFDFGINAALVEAVKKGVLPSPNFVLGQIWNASVDKVKGDNYTRLAATIEMELAEGKRTIVIIPFVKNSGELFAYRLSILQDCLTMPNGC